LIAFKGWLSFAEIAFGASISTSFCRFLESLFLLFAGFA
jgi:hypothetical protein